MRVEIIKLARKRSHGGNLPAETAGSSDVTGLFASLEQRERAGHVIPVTLFRARRERARAVS
jgi:hypothetical protein